MKQILSALTLGLLVASPLAAQDLRVEGRINVSGAGDIITVHGGGGYGARGLWCAASEYASQVLGASGTDRLYVAEGSTINRGVFTTNPNGLNPSSAIALAQSVRTPGANLSVTHANTFCADFRLINNR